ncbi:peroxidase 3-like [Typha angustifolia]|uniref:peroxidase 3-like n=1 Tax=Typha angustifolia TaxID=59011 RepID=UPI003C2D2F0A
MMRRVSTVVLMICVALCLLGCVQANLKLGFYEESCPKAEKLIAGFVKEHIPNAPTLAAAFLRMHFHDCFVRGCDGSVLINSTSNNESEKEAVPNQTLRGFDLIDKLKSLLEEECPGVVSCADILALVARDAVGVIGGPFWSVPTGRRDGVISKKSEASKQIPAPQFNFSALQKSFASKGLNVADLIWLSGAHTIGVAHCNFFSSRLYNFTGKGDQDPSLDSEYAANLKMNKCKTLTDNTTLVEMDPGSFRTFDLDYYRNLVKRRGLFSSDAALITNPAAKSAIINILNGPPATFFQVFAQSMQKMGAIEVKTGSMGEIRKKCAVINS